MDLPDVNPTHAGGALATVLALFYGAKRFLRAERVNDSSASATIEINESVRELIAQLKSQTQQLTSRVEELQKHVQRLDAELTEAQHGRADCERRHEQATRDIQDLRVKLHVFMDQGMP